jgi:two-component system, NarL family, response regulator DevR
MTASAQQPVMSRNGTGTRETEQTPIRCLVVDDHPAILAGLRGLLASEPGFEVVRALDSAEAAAEVAEQVLLDVAIVDYQLPGHSGLWLSRKLKRLPQPPAVLIYSAFSDYMLAAACVVAEADGLLSKSALGSDLYTAIRRAATGMSRLPPVPSTLADGLRRRFDSLEQAIFGLLLAGISRDEIGRTLHIDTGELETRQWTMLRKLERSD